MKKIISTIAAVIIVALMGIFFPEAEPETPAVTTPSVTVPVSGNGLTVHFIDVGQADCALIECGGEYMVIDGGNVEDGQMLVAYLDQQGWSASPPWSAAMPTRTMWAVCRRCWQNSRWSRSMPR